MLRNSNGWQITQLAHLIWLEQLQFAAFGDQQLILINTRTIGKTVESLIFWAVASICRLIAADVVLRRTTAVPMGN